MASDAGAAWAYHVATNHSPQSVRDGRHVLDWANQPLPFKIYTSLEPLPPPADLGRLCRYTNGVTRTLRTPGGEMPFRAAACTGALYHIELYLVCGGRGDLPDGVYHYAAHDHSLRRLRAGDFRPNLVTASGDEPAVARASVVAVLTSTFWRNAWKYQARAYRHSFWDGGTVLANLFALTAADGTPARLVLGFDDASVNRLLDVDPRHEASMCLVALGERGEAVAGQQQPLAVEPLALPTRRLSAYEVEYPEIAAVHLASNLGSGAEAAAWRAQSAPSAAVAAAESRPAKLAGQSPVEDVIRRRGSSRRFTRESITADDLSSIMAAASQPIDADLPGLAALTTPYLIVNAVDGLDPGSYVVDGGLPRLLRAGDVREIAGFLDLGQELAADAALNVYWLADLHDVLGRLGNRGYRAAQLAAAIQAGRVYLAAYALGLGATGLTFFDDEVIHFFSPTAEGLSVMFLMAVGRPARGRATKR